MYGKTEPGGRSGPARLADCTCSRNCLDVLYGVPESIPSHTARADDFGKRDRCPASNRMPTVRCHSAEPDGDGDRNGPTLNDVSSDHCLKPI
jgi:hypothetical protein